MAKETVREAFAEQQPLTGAALKNDNFLGFVERLAAYRDEQHHESRLRRERRLQKLEAYVERERSQITADFRADLTKATEFFEMHQELTERRVEVTLASGCAVRSAESLANWVRPQVNAAYDRRKSTTSGAS